jgi:hypothetical protein
MMKKILVVFFFLILSAASSMANPYLAGISIEDVDYYVLSINNEITTVKPSLDMALAYGLIGLEDGQHTLEIICGNNNIGEGPPVKFFLIKDTQKKAISYTIKKDPEQRKIDPYYDERFGEPLKVRIKF